MGSFVLDQIVSTKIFPHEGQTVLGTGFRKAPGGKGANQAVQAARLGADVTMVGKLGRDANGRELLDTCIEAGINTAHISYDEQTPSGCAVIILEETPGGSAKNRIMVIPGTNMRITTEDVAFLQQEIEDYDLVMLQLEIPMEINELVADIAYRHNVPVMLNPAPSAPLSDSLLSKLTFLSPNEHEAEDLTGIFIAHDGDACVEHAERAARILRSKGVGNVLITLGSAGAVLAGDKVICCPAVANVKAVDPTAAGDSFLAAFCCGICRGWSYEDALLFANHTAALTVSRMGAMPSLPTWAEVEDFMRLHGYDISDFDRRARQ